MRNTARGAALGLAAGPVADIILPLIAVISLLVIAPPSLAEVRDPAARTRVTTLENGLTILTLPDPTTPAVSFQMWVKVGSKDEARYTGLAHLFEHMMFRGTDRLSPESHERLIEGRGGRINAFTTADHTVYFAVVAQDALPLAIELEAERLANLHINEETLASERQVVLEERRMRTEDQPTGRVFEALLNLTFMAHPYRVPVIGWRSDIEQVTVDVCQDFFDAYYAPNNLVLSISGAFDEEDALARVRQAFGRLEPAAVIPRNPTREPPQRGERRATVYFDVRSPILAATWHAPKSGHPDGEALDVASLVLSGGRSSRLYRGLVYDAQQALVYVPDSQGLTIVTDEGPIVLLGCGHSGAVNLLEQVQRSIQDQPIQALMGGMHLFGADDKTLQWMSDRLSEIGLRHLMAGHCTGIEPLIRLRAGLNLTRKTAVVGAVGSRFVYGEGIYPTSIAQ